VSFFIVQESGRVVVGIPVVILNHGYFYAQLHAKEICRKSGAWSAESSGEGYSPTRLYRFVFNCFI